MGPPHHQGSGRRRFDLTMAWVAGAPTAQSMAAESSSAAPLGRDASFARSRLHTLWVQGSLPPPLIPHFPLALEKWTPPAARPYVRTRRPLLHILACLLLAPQRARGPHNPRRGYLSIPPPTASSDAAEAWRTQNGERVNGEGRGRGKGHHSARLEVWRERGRHGLTGDGGGRREAVFGEGSPVQDLQGCRRGREAGGQEEEADDEQEG